MLFIIQNINGTCEIKQNMQNQKISELYTDDSGNPNDILRSAKKFYEELYTEETTSKISTSELFSEISSRKKISCEQLYHCETNISLEKVIYL